MLILKLTSKNLNSVVSSMTKAIKNGKVIVCPTDTVYGLICNANDRTAVEKIFKIKKRPKRKPISIFVNDIKTTKKIVTINKEQEVFLKNNWPGDLTAVLNPKEKVFLNISQGKNTIGVRIPKYRLIQKLIGKSKIALAQTSANISGTPATTKIEEVLKQFKNKKYQPDLVIDFGNLPNKKPSKVVDLTVYPFKTLRD